MSWYADEFCFVLVGISYFVFWLVTYAFWVWLVNLALCPVRIWFLSCLVNNAYNDGFVCLSLCHGLVNPSLRPGLASPDFCSGWSVLLYVLVGQSCFLSWLVSLALCPGWPVLLYVLVGQSCFMSWLASLAFCPGWSVLLFVLVGQSCSIFWAGHWCFPLSNLIAELSLRTTICCM